VIPGGVAARLTKQLDCCLSDACSVEDSNGLSELPVKGLDPTDDLRVRDAREDPLEVPEGVGVQWELPGGRGAQRPRSNAVALFRNPASSRQAGRRPNGSAASHRVPRRGAASAGTGSTSSLKGGHPGGNVGRRVRARRHRSDRGSGLRAPTPAAIPIAPLQSMR
jgi:hypothetical protein